MKQGLTTTRKSTALILAAKLLLALFAFWTLVAHAAPDPIEFDWAIESNQIDKVREWLDAGLNPEYMGNAHGTGLMTAAWHGNIPMMALFLERGGNPRRVNRNGEQALQLAAWNGHLEAIKWLLAHGATLNRDAKHWSALHYAVFNGHMHVARFLLERGADVNAQSPNGSTALMLAAREGREEMAKVLLETGADTNPKNDWGDSALSMAMRYDHYQLGKIISTPEEFQRAVQVPRENYAPPARSQMLPDDVREILKKIRQAQAEKKSTAELRKQLANSMNRANRPIANNATRQPAPLPYQPRTLVITAKRGAPGQERAQIVAGNPAAAQARAESQRKIADLLRQIRLMEAQGRPAEDLRKQLYEAIRQAK
ncbi:MAG: ankyrin repeat domain-containing protein [Candidatus Accumulibacter sp.]|jgi:hypothetical protein|nr:ankyrin repeat domain-containing protein [Accumulibacter sp.]